MKGRKVRFGFLLTLPASLKVKSSISDQKIMNSWLQDMVPRLRDWKVPKRDLIHLWQERTVEA